MQYKTLGNTGLLVSELCLGTMTFGDSGDDMWSQIGRLQQDDADAILRTALDAGINFVDTANIYSFGKSEEILGQALKNLGVRRDDVVVATKVFGAMSDSVNDRGASRRHILSQAEQSLARLQLDHIDLYQLHGFDDTTPIEETLAAFDSLVSRGLVRYVGVSNWTAWQIVKAVGIAEARRLSPIISLQAYYTAVGRDLEREIFPMLRSEKIGLMVWSPLAGGLLTGKYTRDGAAGGGRRDSMDFPPVDRGLAYDMVDVLAAIAGEKGATIPQIAIAWLLHQPVVTSVLVGARRVEQLSDTVKSTEVRLSKDDLARIHAVAPLAPEYPAWMQAVQNSPQ